MNPRLSLLMALLAGASLAAAADPAPTPAPAVASPVRTAAPAAPAPARKDSFVAPAVPFEAFRLVTDRNIFNPNRTGRRDRSAEEQAPRVDVIALVGTMESDRGLRAFFDGSDTAFRKAVHVGDSVEKFKVTQIAPNAVDLDRDGKSLSVHVGQQLRRPEGADWNLIAADVVRSEAAAAAANATAGKIDPTAPVVIPANVDDVTRRLMEKRNKDLKQ